MRPTDDELTFISTATELVAATDSEMAQTFSRLRTSKRLFATVHGLNLMLAQPQNRGLAMQALKRLGLNHGG